MAEEFKIGDIVEARVFRITDFGAFVRFHRNQKGLIHISQVADGYVEKIGDHLKVGDKVSARVLSVKDGKIDLTLKKEKPAPAGFSPKSNAFRSNLLEEKLGKFLEKTKKAESKQHPA